MAPKKVLKGILKKAMTVKALEKAKKKPKALGKAKAKTKLNKKNLNKLGTMTLKEKVEAAAEEGDDVGKQAKILKDKMTSAEKSQLWGRHQTWLKSHPLEKEEFDKKNKTEKGVAAALWLMQVESKKYIHTSKEVSAKELWKKQDT